jgi:hypothetical protein
VSSKISCLILSGSAITRNHLSIRFFSGAVETVRCCVVWMADAWTSGWLVEVGSRHIFSIPFPDPGLRCSWSQVVLFSLFLMWACDCSLYRFTWNHCVCVCSFTLNHACFGFDVCIVTDLYIFGFVVQCTDFLFHFVGSL